MNKYLKIAGVAVLLIIITVGVLQFTGAILLAQWAPALTDNPQQEMNETQRETAGETSQITDCSRYDLDIVEASAETAVVQQTSGQDAIGDLFVTWYYESRPPAQDTSASIDQTMGAAEASSGTEGTLTEVEATSQRCQSVQAFYEPSTR